MAEGVNTSVGAKGDLIVTKPFSKFDHFSLPCGSASAPGRISHGVIALGLVKLSLDHCHASNRPPVGVK